METRIRMLHVTYMRYIDQHLICFVPGKVLDEIKRLLRLIESRFDPPLNSIQLLVELRDLSSMAMEHFDEHILPLLEKREEAIRYKNPVPCSLKSQANKTNKELRKLHKRNRLFKTQVSYLISKTRRLSEKWNRQNLRIKKQSSVIKEQNAKLQVQATRLENHEMTISEMQKKFEELQNNFVDLKMNRGLDVQKSPNISSTSESPKKDVESNTITKNLRKIIQQESLRQKHNNILKRLCSRNTSDNKTSLNKHQSSICRRDDRRKCMSMVDMEIWRRKCPTSRLTYSHGHKSCVKHRAEILLNNKNQSLIETHASTSNTERKTKKAPDFVYQSVIKQRASRVFPLSRLELERKRKTQTYSEIPPKILKNEMNNSMKALDLINKYLPGSRQVKVPVENRNNDNNILSCLDAPPSKRKREDSGEM